MGDEGAHSQPESQVANVGSARLSAMAKLPPGQLSAVAWSAAKGTVVELGHSARQTKDASSALFTWLRLDAERRLGIEINVDDPAILHLFECLLQVESLLQQALAQSKALIEGVGHLADPTPMAAVLPTTAAPLSSSSLAFMWKNLTSTTTAASPQCGPRTTLAVKLAELAQRQLAASCQDEAPTPSLQASVSACLDSLELVRDAEWNTTQWSPNAGEGGSARYRLQRRLKEEVIEPVEKQLAEHDRLRKLLRDQKTWKQTVKSSRREVVAVTKQEAAQPPSPAGSTDIARSSVVGAKQQMTKQYEVAQLKVTELDQEILMKLTEARDRAFETVTRPWSCLAEIRKEFFGELAKQWGPPATILGAPDEDSRRDRARALAAARLQAKATSEDSKNVVGARPDSLPQQQIPSEPSEERDEEEDDELPRVDDAAMFNSGSEDEFGGKELVEEAQAAILSHEEPEIDGGLQSAVNTSPTDAAGEPASDPADGADQQAGTLN
mmetsp:Transcript_4324/g.7362  ORF Transcript_4324/g.7362 Transcript_4324/m.7362 type:complete len:497 (+) Transcript_4324:107-1597(+)